MKKLLSKTPPRLLLLLLAFFCSHFLHAFEVDGIYYNILSSTERTVEVSGADYIATTINIPATVIYDGVSYNVTQIKEFAFDEVGDVVESISVPNSITLIGKEAFRGFGLTEINVANSNPNYTSVDGILFDKNKTRILRYPAGHTNTEYTIPNTVTSIEENAFSSCRYLSSVTIPASVASILGEDAFAYCESLACINVNNDNQNFCSLDGVLFNKNKTTILAYPAARIDTEYIIPNTVTSIKKNTFGMYSNLISVVIPRSVTTIERAAFNNGYNDGLKYIFIESEGITDFAFASSLNTSRSIIYAYESQHDAIKTYFNGSVLPINNLISYDVNASFTKCSFKLYVPDGFVIKDITLQTYGSEESINPQIINNTYVITELAPETNYTVKVLYNKDGINEEHTFSFKTMKPDFGKDIEVSATSTLTSVSLSLIKDIPEASECGILIDGINYALNEGETKSITGLNPNSPEITYYIYVVLNGKTYTSSQYSIRSKSVNEAVEMRVSSTQTTITIKCENGPDEASEYGIRYDWVYYAMHAGETKKITGIIPGTVFNYSKYVKINGEIYLYEGSLRTIRLSPTFTATAVSPISVNLTGSWTSGDAVVTGCQAIVDGVATDIPVARYATVEVPINYNNDLKHTIAFKVIGDGWEFTSDSKSIDTPYLQWHDGEAVATSTRSARLKYEVNLPTGTPGTGIEWRRIDAPALVPSTKAPCEVVNETLVGTLKNLKDDVYYKFRPYYTAIDGKSYYGDWVGLFTGDADVFFEPEVLTYAPTSSEQSVTLSGYALEGSDEIISQGFEYRPSTPVVRATSGWSVVKADGILMKATLTDLIPNATYICRTFVTTSAGTYYGEEQQFTAPALTGIETIEDDTNNELNVALRENPVNGDAHIRISGSCNKATYSVYSLSGTLVIQKEVAADGLWQPVEMDRCVKGMYLMHVVCGNERKSLRIIKR